MKVDKNYLKNIIKECFDEVNKEINESKKIVVKKSDLEKHAKALFNLAKETLERADEELEEEKSKNKFKKDIDKGAYQMFKRDAKDYTTMGNYIKTGQLRKAYNKGAELDTAALDEVPNDTWKWLIKTLNID